MDILDIHTHHDSPHPLEAILNISPEKLQSRLEKHCYSVGIHPWDIHADVLERQWNEIVSAASDANILALGETGLDKCCSTPLEIQQQVFERHILLSEQIQKPLIIHCVHSNAELIKLKQQFHPTVPWIIHGFRGKQELAKEFLRHHFYLSFGEHYQNSAACAVPASSLFIETDESLVDIHTLYEQMSDVRKVPVAELVKDIRQNIESVFENHNYVTKFS